MSETTIHNGVRARRQGHTEQWVLIDEYHPCRSNPPYDYHRVRRAREWRAVLREAGIACETPHTTERLLFPTGTGPGGSIRLGDDMLPGSVALYVAAADENTARRALANHKLAVRDWLDGKRAMPSACK